MKVKDAMHKGVDWVGPDTPVSQLAKLMRDHDVGVIPIRENDRLVGMVTDRATRRGVTMDVVVWLRSLGLGQYEKVFRENEIDETVLPSLTAEDLKELGVAALGHRRKLLDAIAVLRGDTNATPAAAPGPATADASPRDTAERRQVTVMFSDLVGSTALSARMDPEDLREVISAYQKCVAETVRRFGGFVAKYMGDGPVYNWFTEGFDTLDLKEAKALLDKLASPPKVGVTS